MGLGVLFWGPGSKGDVPRLLMGRRCGTTCPIAGGGWLWGGCGGTHGAKMHWESFWGALGVPARICGVPMGAGRALGTQVGALWGRALWGRALWGTLWGSTGQAEGLYGAG